MSSYIDPASVATANATIALTKPDTAKVMWADEAITIANHKNNYDEILQRLKALEATYDFDFVEMSCKNCGGSLQQGINDYVVKCPYCGSVYMIGRYQINSR